MVDTQTYNVYYHVVYEVGDLDYPSASSASRDRRYPGLNSPDHPIALPSQPLLLGRVGRVRCVQLTTPEAPHRATRALDYESKPGEPWMVP